MPATDILRMHATTLQGERITLRPLTEEDWSLLQRWNSDPLILYYSEDDDVQAYTLERTQAIYRTVSQTTLCFIIELNSTSEGAGSNIPIGEGWLQEMNLDRILKRHPGQNCRRIDLMIGEKEHWGKGYGTEAIRLLTNLAFNLGADLVFGCDIADYNPASRRAFEKAGFRLAAQMEQPPGGKAKYTCDMILEKLSLTRFS